MNHIMLDIETLGVSSRSPILALGAAALGSSGPPREFYRAVKPSLAPPFEPSFGTVSWWAQQSMEARGVFSDPDAASSAEMCLAFLEWWGLHADKDTKLWAKPPHFDVVILQHTLAVHGYRPPWSHRNILDLRTLIHLKDPDGALQPPDIAGHHNALSDAVWQAEYLTRLLEA